MVIKPIDIFKKSVLKAREQFWMQELINTIYPYGLNNRIDINDIKDALKHVQNNNDTAIYTLFNNVKNNCTKRGSGNERRNSTEGGEDEFDADTFIRYFTHIDNVDNINKLCRGSIMNKFGRCKVVISLH